MESIDKLKADLGATNVALEEATVKLASANEGLEADITSLKARITALEGTQVTAADIAEIQLLVDGVKQKAEQAVIIASGFASLDAQTESTPAPGSPLAGD